MSGATPFFPLYAVEAWTGTLYLLMYCLFKDSVSVADCVIECYKDC